jgi:cytochrome oxidase Cu insertion factor (SCO1/SenC/PrrC family)
VNGLDARDRFAALPERESREDYNFAHFRTKHIVQDVRRTVTDRGIQPGDAAPDFALPRADGGALRLSDLRGRPVLLHFGSYS